MNEFSDRPFAAGTVVGLRAFRVSDGHLAGVSRRALWQPGENHAACLKGPFPTSIPADHRPASLDCNCGFYAYFADGNDYAHSDYFGLTVTGIIEAYGLVTIGSRGFRAEKARIVALVRPDSEASLVDFDAVTSRYPDVPVYASQQEALAAHPTTQPQDVGIDPAEASSSQYGPGFAGGGYIRAAYVHVSYASGMGQVAASMEKAAQAIKASMQNSQRTTQALTDLLARVNAPIQPPSDHTGPTPVERKKAAAQTAAESRAKAGLSNLGGINRRRRNP